jgi:hypothetical protein
MSGRADSAPGSLGLQHRGIGLEGQPSERREPQGLVVHRRPPSRITVRHAAPSGPKACIQILAAHRIRLGPCCCTYLRAWFPTLVAGWWGWPVESTLMPWHPERSTGRARQATGRRGTPNPRRQWFSPTCSIPARHLAGGLTDFLSTWGHRPNRGDQSPRLQTIDLPRRARIGSLS